MNTLANTVAEVISIDDKLRNILPKVRINKDTTYIPGQFTLSFEYCGKQYVYNTLTHQCLKTELPAETNDINVYSSLIEDMMLVPNDKDESNLYKSVLAVMRSLYLKRFSKVYTILPTMACNARCTYCYETGMKQGYMSEETVEQLIRFIIGNRPEGRIKLRWFGGEPLLCTGLIDHVCECVRKAGIEYDSLVFSNGSLITPEIVEKMKNDWQVKSVQISMDGPEDDYISRKRYADEHDHYHIIMNSMSLMSGYGIKVYVRSNVDEDNWDRIPQFLSDLEAGVTNKDNVSVYFKPLFDVCEGVNDFTAWKKIVAAQSLIEASGFKTVSYVDLKKGFRVVYCIADRGEVVIAPDGKLYSCEHCLPDNGLGDIWHGITDENAMMEFCRMDRIRDKCRTCTFLPVCTPFANCPGKDSQCREVMELLVLDEVHRMIDSKKEN